MNEKKRASNDKYLQQLEDIKIRVPKGYRNIIKKLAEDEGYNGVNPFTINLYNEILKKNGLEEIPNGVKEVKEKVTEA